MNQAWMFLVFMMWWCSFLTHCHYQESSERLEERKLDAMHRLTLECIRSRP